MKFAIFQTPCLDKGLSLYCNQVYWNSLNYIKDNSLNCKIFFIHVPFEKNIENIADFAEKINKSIHLYMKSIY